MPPLQSFAQQQAKPTQLNPVQLMNQSVNQAQTTDQANQDQQRNDLINQIQQVSVGGQLNNTDPLQVDPNRVQNQLNQANQNIAQIDQIGRDASDTVNSDAQNTWNQRLQKLSQDYQTQSNQMRQQMPQLQPDVSSIPPPAGANPDNPGARAVALAQQVAKNNVPYVWGGNSLTQGVDCSGLMQQVYGKIGIQLPRTSTEQAKFGKVVPSIQQALPGDLILEYSPYEPAGLQQFGHVGIYIGNGQVIEAPGTGKNVRIGPIVNMTKIVRPW